MDHIRIPVSAGELLDKITILEIKSERIGDEQKLANVRAELTLLRDAWAGAVTPDETVAALHAQLKEINQALWDIEDRIRDKERQQAFDSRFVELARAVYITNDRRSAVKKQLNQHLGSRIIEEKSYQDYL